MFGWFRRYSAFASRSMSGFREILTVYRVPSLTACMTAACWRLQVTVSIVYRNRVESWTTLNSLQLRQKSWSRKASNEPPCSASMSGVRRDRRRFPRGTWSWNHWTVRCSERPGETAKCRPRRHSGERRSLRSGEFWSLVRQKHIGSKRRLRGARSTVFRRSERYERSSTGRIVLSRWYVGTGTEAWQTIWRKGLSLR